MLGFIVVLVAGLAFWLTVQWMLPMIALRLSLGEALAADTTTLAPVAANKIVPIIAPFAIGEDLVYGDLTLANANGLVPISCKTGVQEVGIDPVSQAQIITIVPGAGSGFRWETSGGLASAVTVYGFALVDNAEAVLLAVQELAVPVTFTADGYQLDVDPVQMTFVLQPLA